MGPACLVSTVQPGLGTQPEQRPCYSFARKGVCALLLKRPWFWRLLCTWLPGPWENSRCEAPVAWALPCLPLCPGASGAQVSRRDGGGLRAPQLLTCHLLEVGVQQLVMITVVLPGWCGTLEVLSLIWSPDPADQMPGARARLWGPTGRAWWCRSRSGGPPILSAVSPPSCRYFPASQRTQSSQRPCLLSSQGSLSTHQRLGRHRSPRMEESQERHLGWSLVFE